MLKYVSALQEEKYQVSIFSSTYGYEGEWTSSVINNGAKLYTGTRLRTKPMLEEYRIKKYANFLEQVLRIVPDVDVIWLYNQISLASVINCLKLKWFKSQVILIEKNELQFAIAKNLSPNAKGTLRKLAFQPFKLLKLISSKLTDLLSAKFSGVVAISTTLEKYYRKSHVIRIPILVDDAWFKEELNQQLFNKKTLRIGYFGAISEEKDGVFSLMQAVQELAEDHAIKCDIYGQANKNVQARLKPFIDSGHISYRGSLRSEEVFEALKNYNLLALIRPLNMQTRYGFSTKLGEYLASGVPVLATKVSDNGFYLKNQESAFLILSSKSINLGELKTTLKKVLDMKPDQLVTIGQEGRNISYQEFRYSIHAPRLAQFIDDLIIQSN
jgi:glycosyltransferase involved in cell wall biosynthesis